MSARRAAGFTLLEVLVGLTLFSLVAVTAYGALRTGSRSWASATVKAAVNDDMRLASAFIRRQLEHTLPISVVEQNRWRTAFDGTAERVEWVSDEPPHLGGGGPHRVILEASGVGDERALYVEIIPFTADEDRRRRRPEALVRRPLVRGLERFSVDYFGAERRDAEPGWRSDWRDAVRLPRLVRLRIETAAAGAWPPVIANLAAEVPIRIRASRRPRGSAEPAPDPGAEEEASEEAGGEVEKANGSSQ